MIERLQILREPSEMEFSCIRTEFVEKHSKKTTSTSKQVAGLEILLTFLYLFSLFPEHMFHNSFITSGEDATVQNLWCD